jgi:hypothetical protein
MAGALSVLPMIYGEIELNLPDMALISQSVFQAAQRRKERNKEKARRNRKLDYLLSGHFECVCRTAMVGSPGTKRKDGTQARHYRCSARMSPRRTCDEKHYINGEKADCLVWEYISNLLTNAAALETGIDEMEERRRETLAPKQQRLQTIGRLAAESEKRLGRWIDDLGDEDNPTARKLLKDRMASEARKRDSWIVELNVLKAEIEQESITPEARAAIREMASCIRDKIGSATYEQKRELLEILNVRVKLEYKDGQRHLRVTCEIATDKLIDFDRRSC